MTWMPLAGMVILSCVYASELGWLSIVAYQVACLVGLAVIDHFRRVPLLGLVDAWPVACFALS